MRIIFFLFMLVVLENAFGLSALPNRLICNVSYENGFPDVKLVVVDNGQLADPAKIVVYLRHILTPLASFSMKLNSNIPGLNYSRPEMLLYIADDLSQIVLEHYGSEDYSKFIIKADQCFAF